MVVQACTTANVFGQEIADEEDAVVRGEMALQKSGKKGSTMRSGTCHPVFLLHLELARSEVDHSLEPLKNSVMFKASRESDIMFRVEALIHTRLERRPGSKCSEKCGEERSPISGIHAAQIQRDHQYTSLQARFARSHAGGNAPTSFASFTAYPAIKRSCRPFSAAFFLPAAQETFHHRKAGSQ